VGWSEGCNYLFLSSITPKGRDGRRAATAAVAAIAAMARKAERAGAGGERDGK